MQSATLTGAGTIFWRHRIEARNAGTIANGAAMVTARTYHDVGGAVTYTLTVNKPTAADNFASVSQIATGTVSVTDAELEAFLLARRSTMTVVSLDGYLTAILIGPKFIDPRLWLGRLVGEAALIADADTGEHLALQAVVHHHNRLSTTFADQPDHYRRMVKPHRDGGIDLLDWGLGFISGIALAPRPWKKVTDPRQPGRALFEPILTLDIGSRAVPLSAAEKVARAVLEIRQLFQEQRRKSMR